MNTIELVDKIKRIPTNKNKDEIKKRSKLEKKLMIKLIDEGMTKNEIKDFWEKHLDSSSPDKQIQRWKVIYDNVQTTHLHSVRISDKKAVVLTRGGIHLETENRSGVTRNDVIKGKFIPTKKLILDGEPVFEIETSRRYRGDATEIYTQAQKEGKVVCRGKASDAINALLQDMALETIKSHTAHGVYINTVNTMEFCTQPHPRDQAQQDVDWEIQKSHSLETLITRENLTSWFDLLPFWHSYEILPAMSLSVIAPFAYILRELGVLVPSLYHYSPLNGLGKSLIQVLYTENLFGKMLQTADSISSFYRLAATLDSYCGAITIDEAEKFPWNKFSPHIKAACERPLQDMRGTTNLGMRKYRSRAVLFFNGNKFPLTAPSDLVRILKIEFDGQAQKIRKNKKQKKTLGGIIKKLEPIGWRLIELELETVGYSPDKLIKNIEEHEERIYDLMVVEDPRRPKVWALIYEGLKIWEHAAVQQGLNWRTPNYETFVTTVVLPIEMMTFESMELPAQDFIAWWEGWKVKNTITRSLYEAGAQSIYDEIKGKDRIWTEKNITLHDEAIKGEVITHPLLREYTKERHMGDLPLNTLSDLGKGIASLTGIPEKCIHKDWKIGNRTYKGVFIPHELMRREIQSNLRNKTEEENPSNQATFNKNGDFSSRKTGCQGFEKNKIVGNQCVTEEKETIKSAGYQVANNIPTPLHNNGHVCVDCMSFSIPNSGDTWGWCTQLNDQREKITSACDKFSWKGDIC